MSRRLPRRPQLRTGSWCSPARRSKERNCSPNDTGQAMYAGAVYLWDATTQAAQERLDRTLAVLGSDGMQARGELGDYRPLRALSNAVDEFKPDRLVICTHAEASSAWLRYEIVDRAHEAYPSLPISHVIVDRPEEAVV